MRIQLNNNAEDFAVESMTVNELLKAKNFTFKMLVIRINDRLIKKNDYDTAAIHDGDEVHVLHLISGG